MTTPTGQIGMSDVNVELLKSSTALVTFNDTDVRQLAGAISGAISMDNMRGKNRAFQYSIAGGTDINLRTASNAGGYVGQGVVILTLAGTYNASSVSVPAVDTGSWPAGTQLTINVSGVITGAGGGGGAGGAAVAGVRNGTGGGAGGPALRITSAITSGSIAINVNGGTIRGGGGGGGGGGNSYGTTNTEAMTTNMAAGGTGGTGANPFGGATGGSAGTASGTGTARVVGGTGGSGGGYGAVGGTGGNGTWPGGTPASPRGTGAGAGGGAGGSSIVNSAWSIIVNSGTILGPLA